MADVFLTQLGGALVQSLTPIPALESQAAQVTAKAGALTDELTADYQRAKKILVGAAVVGGLWLLWRNRARLRALLPRPALRRHRPGRPRRPAPRLVHAHA